MLRKENDKVGFQALHRHTTKLLYFPSVNAWRRLNPL
jgi:hypothetical protein